MKPRTAFTPDFRWQGIPVEDYKPAGERFRRVTRQVLFGNASGLRCELRYFEIQPDGHSTLERHEHAHAVVVVRGSGRALVGREIVDAKPFDLVHVPPGTWHQFRADADAPLGFLCMVDTDRDRPTRPSEADIEELGEDPAIRAFLRV